MINITEEMKKSRQSKIEAIESDIDKKILQAVENGQHSCYFPCDKESDSHKPFYEEIRKKYEDAGYKIIPTGYIGGVWQRTEDICW